MSIQLTLEPLTQEAVSSFGRMTGITSQEPPDLSGEGWFCWYPAGDLQAGAPQLGLVRADPRPLVVEALERHQDREEWVYALDRPYIQVVALSAAADPGKPDANTARAFLIEPGQGLVMNRGIWHAVGLPAGEATTYYGFALGETGPDPEAANSGWVSFANAAAVTVAG
jgi:ureidoglycolate lyase